MIRRSRLDKLVVENIAFRTLFLADLQGIEEVVSATVQVRDARTGNNVSTQMAPDAPVVLDFATVIVRIQQGVDNGVFIARVLATVTGGNQYEHWIDISVNPPL